MRRELRILLVTSLLGATWAWGGELLVAGSRMEMFRINEGDIDIHGLRYLTRETVLQAMELTPESSVWSNTDLWVTDLSALPLVRSANVVRQLPHTIIVSLLERQPVALVPTPTLEPVDGDGIRLPLDPASHRLDLPILETEYPFVEGRRIMPPRTRVLASEVNRLMQADTAFLQMLSEVRWGKDSSLVARWSKPDVDFLLPFGLSAKRLREGLIVLAHAMNQTPHDLPKSVDLRFADLVVVRRVNEN